MKVRRLDSAHDWTFGRGLASYALDSEAIAQNVITALLSLRTDWFLNIGHGVRWFNYLKKNPDIMAMEAELKTTVLNTGGVVRLVAFDIDVNEQRECTVTVSYIDIFGSSNEVSANVTGN